MTPALRKRHQQIWWILGLLLPIIWAASMMVINKQSNKESLLREGDKESGFFVGIKKEDTYQSKNIFVDVYGTIPSPQTLVYLSFNEKTSIENSQLLGRIDGKGSYSFELDSLSIIQPIKIVKGFNAINKKEVFSTIINNQ